MVCLSALARSLARRCAHSTACRYQHYDHIGYNVFGQKLLKSEEADRIDRFLSRTDDPAYWRTVRDELNARDVVLSERELDLIRAMQVRLCV